MKTIGKRKWLILPVLFLLLLAAVFFGSRAWGQYRSTHHKLYAEIIRCSPDNNSVLAAEMGNQYGSLFTFAWPEGADPALKQPGMLVELTGPDSMNMTYPGQYGPVLAVKKTGQREDFIAKYYDTLLAERKKFPVPGEGQEDEPAQEEKEQERQALFDAIAALPDLNDEEREGLYYLLCCELNNFS